MDSPDSDVSKHQNNPLVAQTAAPNPEFLIQEAWKGAPDFASLPGSQVLLLLLVWGPHLGEPLGGEAVLSSAFLLTCLVVNSSGSETPGTAAGGLDF